VSDGKIINLAREREDENEDLIGLCQGLYANARLGNVKGMACVGLLNGGGTYASAWVPESRMDRLALIGLLEEMKARLFAVDDEQGFEETISPK
jgi:hypothetical protein